MAKTVVSSAAAITVSATQASARRRGATENRIERILVDSLSGGAIERLDHLDDDGKAAEPKRGAICEFVPLVAVELLI